MDLRIKDKINIVTGGGKGTGKAIALRLAAEGAVVVVADLNEKDAQGVVNDKNSLFVGRNIRKLSLCVKHTMPAWWCG